MNIENLLKELISKGGSDLHIQTDCIPSIRIEGHLTRCNYFPLQHHVVESLFSQLRPSDEAMGVFRDNNTTDFKIRHPMLGPFRVNVSRCLGGLSISIRPIDLSIRKPEQLGFSTELFKQLASIEDGMILFTGPTGSGKSSSLASFIHYTDSMNRHIITLEDPIEYIYEDTGSLITQRELYIDFHSYEQGIATAMRQDPDVILVGEMRNKSTINSAILAAETGHLVLSTLHTRSVDDTKDRIYAAFDNSERDFMRTVVDSTLRAIINQRLVYDVDLRRRVLKYDFTIF